MAESCPQPLLTLPAADWNAYLKGVYGDANASTLVHLNGHKVVDVLNVSLLRSISARAREYADTIEASFPRHHAWGPCFNNSCDSRHFVPNLNVHCPVELAWRRLVSKDTGDSYDATLSFLKDFLFGALDVLTKGGLAVYCAGRSVSVV